MGAMWEDKLRWFMWCEWGATHKLITDEHGLMKVAIDGVYHTDEIALKSGAEIYFFLRDSQKSLRKMLKPMVRFKGSADQLSREII